MFSQIWSDYISGFLSQEIIVQIRTGVLFINNTVIQDDLHSPAYPHSILYGTIPVTKGAEDANEVTLQRGRDGLAEYNTGKKDIEETK